MQKDGRSDNAGDDVTPINHLIEIIKLARVMKTGSNEGKQAKQEEVERLGRARPPVIHEQADEQPGDADPVLIIYGGVAFRSIDVNVLLVKFDATPAQSVGCLLRQIVAPNATKRAGYIERAAKWVRSQRVLLRRPPVFRRVPPVSPVPHKRRRHAGHPVHRPGPPM